MDSNRDRDQEEELVNRALDMRAEEVAQGPGAGDTVEVPDPRSLLYIAVYERVQDIFLLHWFFSTSVIAVCNMVEYEWV